MTKKPPHKGTGDDDSTANRRLGGSTRGGRHADRGGTAGTSRTAKPSKKIGRPPGEHRKDK